MSQSEFPFSVKFWNFQRDLVIPVCVPPRVLRGRWWIHELGAGGYFGAAGGREDCLGLRGSTVFSFVQTHTHTHTKSKGSQLVFSSCFYRKGICWFQPSINCLSPFQLSLSSIQYIIRLGHYSESLKRMDFNINFLFPLT